MPRSPLTKALSLGLMTLGAVSLSACGTVSKLAPTGRMETAKRIAGPAHMMETHIPVGEFTLLSFEKVHAKGKPATVYIEGDGNLGWDDLTLIGIDPTPVVPSALLMAADDGGPNVVWLARPCQYAGAMGSRDCTKALFTTHRYSPQAIDSVNAALDNLKRRYAIPSFSLVGHGGGAAIAVELAAVRNDVTFIRTVAGVLDTRIAAPGERMRAGMDPFAGSLNPIDAAPKVAHIPQMHSVGSWDKAQTLAMINSFMAAEGNPSTAVQGPDTGMDSAAAMPTPDMPADCLSPDAPAAMEPMQLNN